MNPVGKKDDVFNVGSHLAPAGDKSKQPDSAESTEKIEIDGIEFDIEAIEKANQAIQELARKIKG
ncbi:MAG: hypothetical protein JSR46_03535 [Verrucomicrobia bacterium]|nr:hypothetical protein [Verrucomicrobiota bacterium]